MQVIRESVKAAADHEPKASVLVLGNFDGVHQGHRLLLEEADRLGKKLGLHRRVLTFSPHPKKRQQNFKLIYEDEQKAQLMAETGWVDELIFLTFDENLKTMSPEDFFDEILRKRYTARAVVIGDNFHFGYQGKGDAKELSRLCEAAGIVCRVMDRKHKGEEPISSSRIRTLIEEGRMEEAALLLGRPYFVEGTVKRGKQLGQKMQTPTINLLMEENRLAPKSGVYVSRTQIAGKGFPSVSNVGHNPTVGGESLRTETHILDFSGDLYEQQVRVELLRFLRPEKRFESVQALYHQLAKDVMSAKKYFMEEKFDHEEV